MGQQFLKAVHYWLNIIAYTTMQDKQHPKHTYQPSQNRLKVEETYSGLEYLICQQTESLQ